MRKQCTNSACRKKFVADSVCPYCGKEYPRIPSIKYDVQLINSGKHKIYTVMMIRRLNNTLSLDDIKKMVENCPCIIGEGMTRKEAVLWCKVLNEVGALAMMK